MQRAKIMSNQKILIDCNEDTWHEPDGEEETLGGPLPTPTEKE